MQQMMQCYGGINAFTNPTPQPTRRPMLALSDDGSPTRTLESGSPASAVAHVTPPRASTEPASTTAEQLPPLSPSEQANAMMAAWNAKADHKREEKKGEDDEDADESVMKKPCMKRPAANGIGGNSHEPPSTKPKPKAKSQPKSKAKSQPKYKAKSAGGKPKYDVTKLSQSARLRLRPNGCSKCRWKPGCCDSCWK